MPPAPFSRSVSLHAGHFINFIDWFWFRVSAIGSRRCEGFQQFLQVDDGDAGGDVAHGVGKDEIAGMDHSAAGVNDVWDITKSLPAGRNEYRLAGLADDLTGIVEVQQDRADA